VNTYNIEYLPPQPVVYNVVLEMSALPFAPVVREFANQSDFTLTHNRGRAVAVAVQVGGETIGADVSHPDANTVRIRLSTPLSGVVIII
jgi:hypothetical protein